MRTSRQVRRAQEREAIKAARKPETDRQNYLRAGSHPRRGGRPSARETFRSSIPYRPLPVAVAGGCARIVGSVPAAPKVHARRREGMRLAKRSAAREAKRIFFDGLDPYERRQWRASERMGLLAKQSLGALEAWRLLSRMTLADFMSRMDAAEAKAARAAKRAAASEENKAKVAARAAKANAAAGAGTGVSR